MSRSRSFAMKRSPSSPTKAACQRVVSWLTGAILFATAGSDCFAQSLSLYRSGESATQARPAGELAARITLSQNRLTGEGFPTFSPQFVLADVRLDPDWRRLYQEFSGDISGRYIEALSVMPPPDGLARLRPIVGQLLDCQREDGRFGDPALSFTNEAIGRDHMALLWGNGRLLVGLMACYRATGDQKVLEAARRLGDFLLRVRKHFSQPEVARWLATQGARGYVCFTQLIEGLVMLGQKTEEAAYLAEAKAIIPLLPPRGVQHSHGYLSTLRGALLLHEATGDEEALRFVKDAYAELVDSPDYQSAFGGVLEFFGTENYGVTRDDIKKLADLDNKDPQDEGCAEADFLRLSLQLWRLTGKSEYLDRAERCLLNHFFFNQFYTGDFGHHILYENGFRPSEQQGMAWWCCTMHGLRAFGDVVDSVVTKANDTARVNLFLEGTWSFGSLELTTKYVGPSRTGAGDIFRITLDKGSAEPISLAVRQPPWAESLGVSIDSRGVETTGGDDGYCVLQRPCRPGESVDVHLDYRVCLETRERKVIPLQSLGSEPVEAALYYGPWLMCVHELDDPLFVRRPWKFAPPNASVIELPEQIEAERAPGFPQTISRPPLQLRLDYHHGGWPNTNRVVMRRFSEQTAMAPQQVTAVWLHFRRQETGRRQEEQP
jgi:DUF1680 family protein